MFADAIEVECVPTDIEGKITVSFGTAKISGNCCTLAKSNTCSDVSVVDCYLHQ